MREKSCVKIKLHHFSTDLFTFTGCCYFLHSAINPFLYSLLSKRFRRGFHDLSNRIKNCRNQPATASREHQIVHHAPIPENVSFCINNRHGTNRNVMKRHYNLAKSSGAQSDNDTKLHHKLLFEMQGIASHGSYNSHGNRISTYPLCEAQRKQINLEAVNVENTVIDAPELKHRNKQLKCKYKIVFKRQSNQRLNNSIEVETNADKTIPRCSGTNDLRNVGASSASSGAQSCDCFKGTHLKGGIVKFRSVSEGKSKTQKHNLSSVSCKA